MHNYVHTAKYNHDTVIKASIIMQHRLEGNHFKSFLLQSDWLHKQLYVAINDTIDNGGNSRSELLYYVWASGI